MSHTSRIVAEHGLGSNTEHTWTCKPDSKSQNKGNRKLVHLLKDLLMKVKRFLDARMLHFAYNADWLVDACFESAHNIGRCLRESLIEHRKDHAHLPLIFVGHSFGGIVIKEYSLEESNKILLVAGFGATIAYLSGFLGSNTGLLLLRRSHDELLIVQLQSAAFGSNYADVYEVDKDHSGLNKCLDSEDSLINLTAPPKLNKLQQDVLQQLMPATLHNAVPHPGVDEDECLPQTRGELLKDICDWLDESNPSHKHLYWLEGKARTGKSTIARTFVSSMIAENRVVATTFYALIAQLVRKLPSPAITVQNVLASDPSLPEQDPRAQFKKLFQESSQKQEFENNSKSIVVVVDALNECNFKDDITALAQPSSGQLLTITQNTQSDYNKVPEQECKKKKLEEATLVTTKQDIKRHLWVKLEKVDGILDLLRGDDPWSNPSDVKNLKKFAERACPLFEFAALLVVLSSDSTIFNDNEGARSLLHDILESQSSGDLDNVYASIMDQRFLSLKDQHKVREVAHFCKVIGSIIALADSVSAACLAKLLNLPEPIIRQELRLFESVAVTPAEHDNLSAVRLFHESFGYFLVDLEANKIFSTKSMEAHVLLASRCHQLLSDALHDNMCKLRTPGTYLTEYACRFWILHVKRSGSGF
ncbi:hypothetical protein V8C42DRAFT_358933 [Trichoderma barbatum]